MWAQPSTAGPPRDRVIYLSRYLFSHLLKKCELGNLFEGVHSSVSILNLTQTFKDKLGVYYEVFGFYFSSTPQIFAFPSLTQSRLQGYHLLRVCLTTYHVSLHIINKSASTQKSTT